MTELEFELESENWKGLYDLAVETLKTDKDDAFAWFCRTTACVGLTTEENDKSKEALTSMKMFVEKSTGDADFDITRYVRSIETILPYWSRQLTKARQGEMSRDKPDNINYGLQMMAGDLAHNIYAASHAEKILNINEASLVLATKYNDKQDFLVQLLEMNRRLLKIGFDKSLNEKVKQDSISRINEIRKLIKKIDPNYVSPSASSSGCLVLIIAFAVSSIVLQAL